METGLLADLSLGAWGLAVALAMALALIVLAALSVRFKVLTPGAAVTSVVVGAVLLALGGIPYLAVILFFVLEGAIVTRYRFEEKHRRNVGEGKEGERAVPNVLAHVVVPLALVVPLPFLVAGPWADAVPFLYCCAIAFGAADTSASEIGVLASGPVGILSLRPVKPGTNGGISGLGEVAGFVAALLVGLVGLGLFLVFGFALDLSVLGWVLGVAVLGWVGCQLDSVLGATLENRGVLGKTGVNFLAMLATVALGALVILAFPLLPVR